MFNNYKKFFRNKRVLIMGNTGFVGSYLSLTLNFMDSKILGYSLKKKDKGYLSNNPEYKKIKTIYDDLINVDKYRDIIKDLNHKY